MSSSDAATPEEHPAPFPEGRRVTAPPEVNP